MKESKTQKAMALIKSGMNPHAAAAKVGITSSMLYTKLRRDRFISEGRCPTCERKMPK
jgi:hypothetical protein